MRVLHLRMTPILSKVVVIIDGFTTSASTQAVAQLFQERRLFAMRRLRTARTRPLSINVSSPLRHGGAICRGSDRRAMSQPQASVETNGTTPYKPPHSQSCLMSQDALSKLMPGRSRSRRACGCDLSRAYTQIMPWPCVLAYNSARRLTSCLMSWFGNMAAASTNHEQIGKSNSNFFIRGNFPNANVLGSRSRDVSYTYI